MNQCLLMGEIIAEPQLRYTPDNQTPIAEFTVSFPGLRPEDATQQLKVVGWGNLAQEIQTAQYHVGDRVLLEGRLTMSTLERPEGFKEKLAELTAQRVHRLNDLSTMSMTAVAATPTEAVPTAAPAVSPSAPAPRPATVPTPTPTPEPEVDYDDIPF